jgi:hypothetical protein
MPVARLSGFIERGADVKEGRKSLVKRQSNSAEMNTVSPIWVIAGGECFIINVRNFNRGDVVCLNSIP